MKILGIGIDLVKNVRMEVYLTQSYRQRFLKKFLHPTELESYFKIENDNQKVQFLASRWAVKEALNKAIGRKEFHYNEIYIKKDKNGRPIAAIEGDENQRLLLEMQIAKWHISLSHEREYTIGMAVVEQHAE